MPGRLLIREARHGRIQLVVPEVAFDETVNLFKRAMADQYMAARKALRRLQGIEVLDQAKANLQIDIQAEASAYATKLRAVLKSAGADFLPYPKASHSDLVRRALDRRRPFDAAGKDGYRDALIWEALVENADPDRPIVLVSGDKRAFGANQASFCRSSSKSWRSAASPQRRSEGSRGSRNSPRRFPLSLSSSSLTSSISSAAETPLTS